MSKLGKMAIVIGAVDLVPAVVDMIVKNEKAYTLNVLQYHRWSMGMVGAGLVEDFWPRLKKIVK